MIKYQNECVGCPPEMGCYGSACSYTHVPRYYCDECGDECDSEDMRRVENQDLCSECLLEYALKYFPKVEED